MSITFIEHPVGGYPERTIENIKQCDCTIAIASDFNTPGEKLTKRTCYERGKLYIPVRFQPDFMLKEKMDEIVEILDSREIHVVNVAGNGIYSILQSQDKVDSYVSILLASLFSKSVNQVNLIRSGGQTGVDEAGLKAAVKLGLDALCLAPHGWKFRDENHLDISNEFLFKQRFNNYI